MSNPDDSGFGKKKIVNGLRPKSDPGARPALKDSAASPLAGSVAQRDWVKADMDFKENSPQPKYE